MKINAFVVFAAASLWAAFARAAPAPTHDPGIIVVIESPGEAVSGIGLIAGYALSKKGAIDYVTWSVDGEDKGFIPYGGSRGDVAAAHPGYADSMDPGYATAWNYNHFEPGDHELVVRAYDDRGGYNEAKTTFETTRFGDGADKFLLADEIELTSIPLANLRLYPDDDQGDAFEVELMWAPEMQQFAIKKIVRTCTFCSKLAYAAPTLDDATRRVDKRVELQWSGGTPVVAYAIERRTVLPPAPTDDGWEHVGTAAGTERRFVDDPHVEADPGTIIPLGLVYEYRIRGLGPSNKSAYSNVESVPAP